jgi:hypothetical protein
MFPLRDDNPPTRTPVVTRGLIALNTLAFLFQVALGAESRGFLMAWGFVPERLVAGLTGEGAIQPVLATLVSSMFLHGGWLHLIGNMWYLWIFGDNVEDLLGRGRFLGFYLVSGVVSALVHALFNPWSPLPTVGASGAVAGVLGAYALAFPRARVVTLLPLVVVFHVIALPAMLVLGLWFVFQFLSGAFAAAGGATGGVAWWAHIGGFAFGWLAMARMARTPRESKAWVQE